MFPLGSKTQGLSTRPKPPERPIQGGLLPLRAALPMAGAVGEALAARCAGGGSSRPARLSWLRRGVQAPRMGLGDPALGWLLSPCTPRSVGPGPTLILAAGGKPLRRPGCCVSRLSPCPVVGLRPLSGPRGPHGVPTLSHISGKTVTAIHGGSSGASPRLCPRCPRPERGCPSFRPPEVVLRKPMDAMTLCEHRHPGPGSGDTGLAAPRWKRVPAEGAARA